MNKGRLGVIPQVHPGWATLPEDLIIRILKLVSYKDVSSASQVCEAQKQNIIAVIIPSCRSFIVNF